MRAKAGTLDEISKSIAESDDDTTRSSSGGGSSGAAQRKPDLSLLRKPILTAVTGFLEAHKAYEAGTEELRKLLTSECDLLYECRVCRNIFRSLTNFISHKRVYCRKLFNAAQNFHFQNDGFLDQDIATILQAEQESQRKAKRVHADILNKDLSSIIERLKRKQHNSNSVENNLTDYYDKINCKIAQDDLKRQQHVLQLDSVPHSRAAVYQTVRHGIIADNMQAQVGELENLANNNNTVLGLDGKVLDPSSRPQSTTSVAFESTNQYFKPIETDKVLNCHECNLQFDTESMLQLHGEMKHTPSTFVYTCPSCPQTFMTPGSVIRHLSNDHKKSMRRIKLMREAILKRRTRMDELVLKAPSREVSRLLQSAAGSNTRTSSPLDQKPSEEARDEAAATRAWMENLEHFDHGPMCSYCGKTFDRKAVLATHRQTCTQKIRQTENGAVSVPLPSKAGNSSGRRSKVKHSPASPQLPVGVKIKQEPEDSTAHSSDESNSNDVPLAALQSRIPQDQMESTSCASVSESVLTIKPEELASLSCTEGSRRKRKKPTIMLRNATDDISWEQDEPQQDSSADKNEELIVPNIKKEPTEYTVTVKLPPKAKRAPRVRKKRAQEEELNEKEMRERLEVNGEIVCRCGKRYDDPEKYKRHLRVFHNRQRRYWCAVCDFKGYRKVDTVNHLLQDHSYKGDQKDIGSLINIQPVEKDDKILPEETTQPISSVIESVNRNCDTSGTDISFTESTACNASVDTSNTAADLTNANLAPPVRELDESPRKRARQKIVRESLSLLKDSDSKSKVVEQKDDDCTSPTSKRPIRNRIKPVDKDFVYDLTHFLHKEEDLEDFPLPELVVDKPVVSPIKPKSEPSRTPSASQSAEKRVENKRETLRSHAPKPKLLPPELTRGAAYQMAKRQVDQGLAAFYRLPELPQERAFNPGRISPQKKRSVTGIQDWPVIKKERKSGSITKDKSDRQIKRKYTKRASTGSILPELIREKRKSIPRRNSVVPLPQKISASIEILNKLNASRSAAGLEVVRMTDFPVMVKCPTEAEFRRYIEAHLTDHRAKLSQVNLNGTTAEDVGIVSLSAEPRKRITLMQRLQENRSKRLQQTTSPAKSDGTAPTVPSSLNGDTSKPLKVTELLQAKLKRCSSM
ncbi:uncharacterized protein LOC129718377 [Wyeomyia smithii]|uniref:uncharacterized protein LOC129718377 n=1 Tax=Wyeomyia smithii TaxID=174621 RepID=UPI002467AE04|nr:uncharacterized protein LOC129718377 [Wyeomyia smithii]XP_055525091.1 uncharacterized protein LOC129718377 [Wyeomyia smithii]XP_055525092.1 uncharacterized protein LOC129718377 [Wyeomyia smithii]XP_055525093.1 uncharacterized protein LOC129718377 [Wyeomyia smithii]